VHSGPQLLLPSLLLSLLLVICCCADASLLIAVIVAHGIHVLRAGGSLSWVGVRQHSMGLQVKCSAMLLGTQPESPCIPWITQTSYTPPQSHRLGDDHHAGLVGALSGAVELVVHEHCVGW